ncbi:MAG: hypothetical protein C0510_00095 [Erythrobacter sp.]|nr:hypothetical protein [Erythrobacter sp.]MBA4163024.1 hypothetical protein [Erythrobacter sp.]
MYMAPFSGPLTAEGQNTLSERDRVHLVPSKLKRVTAFIEANLDKRIGLADLAHAAGLSPNHFLRVFKRATGDTPYQYLRARRLQRACELLSRSSLPLAELALDCGFANQAHFTAAFTRQFGVPPGRYRRAIRSKTAPPLSVSAGSRDQRRLVTSPQPLCRPALLSIGTAWLS